MDYDEFQICVTDGIRYIKNVTSTYRKGDKFNQELKYFFDWAKDILSLYHLNKEAALQKSIYWYKDFWKFADKITNKPTTCVI